MINTLLEHVPIKMEVKDIEEAVDNPTNDNVKDDDDIDETDDDDDDEDEEETDIESEVLEIEQEATMLISSDEEAELEAQRIRFPHNQITKKLREDSNKSSRSSSIDSQTSNTSSNTHITYEIITKNFTTEETEKKQKISSPSFRNLENAKTFEIINKENNNNSEQDILQKKIDSKQLENKSTSENNKNENLSCKLLDNNKTDTQKNSQTKPNIENAVTTPADVTGQPSRRTSNNSACSVASSVASDKAETESCGNIYVFNLRQKLIFNCDFCDLKYGALDNFGRHLHEAHKVFNLDEGAEKENAPRNLTKTNRITNNAAKNSANVKKEPLQCLELLAEPPVALPPSVLAEPLDSCGNVFMLNHRRLFLVCGYCECKYANLDLFEKHLRQQHRIFEGSRNELNVVPKVEVKEEVYIITEVADKTDKNVIAAPHAMVSIPAEIPLNISNNSEDNNDTAVVVEEPPVESSVNEELAPPTALIKNVLDSKETKELQSSVQTKVIPDTKLEVQASPDVNKEKCVPEKVVDTEILASNISVHSVEPMEQQIVNNEILLPKQTRSSRRSSPAVPLTRHNKICKRSTRTITTVRRESTTIKKEVKMVEKAPETAQIIQTEEVAEVPIKQTKATKKSTKTAEPMKATIAEKTEETRETKKSTKHAKSLKANQTKSTTTQETEESENATKSTESKKRKFQENIVAAKDPEKNTKPPTQIKKLKQERPEIEEDSNENKFKCSICSKELASKYSLNIHERTHTGEKPYECDICRKCFGSRSNLCHHKKFHMDESHKKYKCEICDMKFFHGTDLKIHTATHSCEKKFKCDICSRDYSSKSSLQKHIEREHKPDEEEEEPRNRKKKITRKQIAPSPKVELEIEPQLSTVTSSIIEPMTKMLLPAEKTAMDDLSTDPVDDIIEQLQNEMAQNELRTSEVNAVTYTIKSILPESEVANKSSESNSIVSNTPHDEIKSTAKTKPTLLKIVKRFFCDVCPSGFDKHTRLVEHKRVHTGERPFACDECGKQFRVRIRLKEHKLRHSKEKKFKCEICQLGCCTKQDLNLHMRHHTNDRRYQCVMCPKAFVRSSDLKIHVRVHTGEKPYVCDICHKCFRANQNLCVHKKSHMGEASKTYKCEHCDKKFMRNIDRKVHMRSHTGEKPYKCEICQRGYSSKVNVRAHIERDHISTNGGGKPPKGKKKPGPKPRALREELEKQRKLIQELQNQLWQQIKTDEKIIPSDEEMLQQQQNVQDTTTTTVATSPLSTTCDITDPIQSAYELLNKLKSSTATSKPLTVIPSPPPMADLPSNPFTKPNKDSTTLLPLTITQKLEQASPTPAPSSTSSSSASASCHSTPSPPKATTTATKVVSQKTSLGIQQVSVTVSMQVENVTATPVIPEKDNAIASSTNSSVKKERKITSYFTVVGQKAEV